MDQGKAYQVFTVTCLALWPPRCLQEAHKQEVKAFAIPDVATSLLLILGVTCSHHDY